MYFAHLKEKCGKGEEDWDVRAGCSVVELRRLLPRLKPELSNVVDGTAIAVNMEYADDGRELQEGDVVALIPPVSGG